MTVWLHHYLYGLCEIDDDEVGDFDCCDRPKNVRRFRTLSGIRFQARLSSITLEIQE